MSGRPVRRPWSGTAGDGEERTVSRDSGEGVPSGAGGVQEAPALWAVQLRIFRPGRCPLEEWLDRGGRGGVSRGGSVMEGHLGRGNRLSKAPELEGF